MSQRIRQEWKSIKGGYLLSGLIGSRGFKTKQCHTVRELIVLAQKVFPITDGDLHSTICQIRDLQETGVVRLTKRLSRQLGPKIVVNNVAEATQGKIDEFYDSWEWKRVRYDFLKGKNRRCQCCGSSAADGTRIVVDHIKPIRKYWHLRLESANLQILCDDCNKGKGSRDETDWRPSQQEMIESIMNCIFERGVSALKEPANLERLLWCDESARDELNRRIGAYKQAEIRK